MPAPPIAGAASPQTPMTGALAQGLQIPGAQDDAQTQAIVDTMGAIRDIKTQVDALGADFPVIAPLAAQVAQLLLQMSVQIVSTAPSQTASGVAVPMGGGGM